MAKPRQEETKSWIEKIIRDFCTSPANSLGNDTGEPAWGEPAVRLCPG